MTTPEKRERHKISKEDITYYKELYEKFKNFQEVTIEGEKTTFSSCVDHGWRYCITVKNSKTERTRIYNEEVLSFSKINNKDNLWNHWKDIESLDGEALKIDLEWFRQYFPSLKDKAETKTRAIRKNIEENFMQ